MGEVWDPRLRQEEGLSVLKRIDLLLDDVDTLIDWTNWISRHCVIGGGMFPLSIFLFTSDSMFAHKCPTSHISLVFAVLWYYTQIWFIHYN